MPLRRHPSPRRTPHGPGARLPIRPRPAAGVAESHVDAVLHALDVVFNNLDASSCCQKIDGSALVEPDGRALEPLFRLAGRAEHCRRFREYLGEFPCATALLP